jgi:hypothetical protein
MVLILGGFIAISPRRYVMQILRTGKQDFRLFFGSDAFHYTGAMEPMRVVDIIKMYSISIT